MATIIQRGTKLLVSFYHSHKENNFALSLALSCKIVLLEEQVLVIIKV
jgi:hypothetical protein